MVDLVRKQVKKLFTSRAGVMYNERKMKRMIAMMKRVFSIVLACALLLGLCACGGTAAAPTAAPTEAAKPREGITFTTDRVWRATEVILEVPNTIEVWVKMPETAGGETVLVSTSGDSAWRYIDLTVDAKGRPTLTWLVNKKLEEKTEFVWTFKNASVSTGDWAHLAIVRDVEAGKVFCYVNGEKQDEILARHSMDALPVRPYCVGGDHDVKNARAFKGEISSVAIFSTARTQEQVQADMVKPEGEGLLCHYELAGATETVKDLSGNGRDMLLSTRWFTEKEPVTDFAYSMVVVGDTQLLALKNPDRMPMIADWIIENKEAKNIQFVMGVGDITEDDTLPEWEAAKETYYRLDGVVPYGLVRGNSGHDGITNFEASFPLSKYEGTFTGNLGDDMRNVYYNFDAGKVKYTVIILDAIRDAEELAWAEQVIMDNKDRNVILVTHIFLCQDGTFYDSNDPWPFLPYDGSQVWENLARKHENVKLVICGHDSCAQVMKQEFVGDNGNVVTALLVDGQHIESTDGASGLIAVLHFSEDGKNVTVEYLSTVKNQYFLTENQFSFTLETVE